MAEYKVTKTRISAGIWEGVIDRIGAEDDVTPLIDCMAAGEAVDGIDLTPDETTPNRWVLRVPIPAQLLHDGIQVFTIVARDSGEALAHFTILLDAPLDDAAREELALLRGELDILKSAVRRLASGKDM